MIDGFMATKIARTEYETAVRSVPPVYEFGNVYENTTADQRRGLLSTGAIGALRTLVAKGVTHLRHSGTIQPAALSEDALRVQGQQGLSG